MKACIAALLLALAALGCWQWSTHHELQEARAELRATRAKAAELELGILALYIGKQEEECPVDRAARVRRVQGRWRAAEQQLESLLGSWP